MEEYSVLGSVREDIRDITPRELAYVALSVVLFFMVGWGWLA